MNTTQRLDGALALVQSIPVSITDYHEGGEKGLRALRKLGLQLKAIGQDKKESYVGHLTPQQITELVLSGTAGNIDINPAVPRSQH